MKIEIKERIEKIKNKEMPEGYRKTKFGPIPKSWKEITIASLVKEKKELCSDEITPLYSLTIEAGIIPKSERYEREHLVKDTESAYKKVNINEFAYNPMNVRFGAIARLLENKTVKVSKYYNIFEVKKNVDLMFFEAVIKNKRALNYYDSISTGTLEEKKRVHYNDFIKIEIPFPPIEEQEKISTILSKWDEGISNQEKLIEAKKKYKKGMMQKIFSQELRFKDENGNNYPEWEEKRLGEILFEHKEKNKERKILEVFSVAKEKGVINQIEHLGRSFASNDTSNYKIVFENDIVYTKSPTSDFPFGIIKQNMTNRKGIVSTLYAVYKPVNKYIGFLLDLYFKSPINTYNYLNPLVNKGAKNTMNINNSDFLNGAKIKLPVNIKEQEKIANFLSIIDKEIELLEKELNILELEKKGLNQLILTGIIRTS